MSWAKPGSPVSNATPTSSQKHPQPSASTRIKKTPDEVIEEILYLRRTDDLHPIRIASYLQRYHDIQTSAASVYRICKRHGLNRLPNRLGRRAVHTHRYQKRVPGHPSEVDVEFLT